jgi:hypothetical protein
MIILIAEAFLMENNSLMEDQATGEYKKSIKIADEFGEFGNLYRAIAYMGMSRIAYRQGKDDLGRKYKRSATKNTGYEYIIKNPFEEDVKSNAR